MNSKCKEGIHNPVLAGGMPVCADCGFSLQPPPTEPEGSVCSSEARGSALEPQRLKQAKIHMHSAALQLEAATDDDHYSKAEHQSKAAWHVRQALAALSEDAYTLENVKP